MQTVTVHKTELKKIIEENRAAHKGIFEEAVEGYREMVTKDLESHLERVASGSLVKIYISHPVPGDHTGDYDRVLRMIEMSIGEEIVISQVDFARYVMDDWDWKEAFIDTANSYTGGKFGKPTRYDR